MMNKEILPVKYSKSNFKFLYILFSLFIFSECFSLVQVRIKDIVIIEGLRENQLLGIGLVVGLAGQGDSSN